MNLPPQIFLIVGILLAIIFAAGLTNFGATGSLLFFVGLVGWSYQGLDAYDLARRKGMRW